jgi:hypothetical protein
VPCLGPRVHRTAGPDGDLPHSALRPGILTGRSLTMYDPVYQGVTELKTSGGIVRALQFTMTRAVTEPFRLEVPEAGGDNTVITSSRLTISQDVKFYTTRFSGKFLGIIPMVFTPELPPPLTVTPMYFTDVNIELTLVQCGTLTANKLDISVA